MKPVLNIKKPKIRPALIEGSFGKILLVALLLRALLPLGAILVTGDSSVFHAPDTGSYLRPASRLVETGVYGTTDSPEIIRPPGYSLFLAPAVLIGQPEILTILLQIAFSLMTVVTIYGMGLLLSGRVEVATLCALLFALEPLSVLYTGLLVTETLFSFLVTFGLYCLLKYVRNQNLPWLLMAGLAIAAATYVRPISYFMPVLLAVLLIVWIVVRFGLRRNLLLHVVLFLSVSITPLAAWQVRNAIRTGYTGFSPISDIYLYFYQAASVLAAKEGGSYYQKQMDMGYQDLETYFRQHPEQRGWELKDRYRYMRNEGLRIVWENGWTYTGIHAKGILRILFDPGATEYLRLFKQYPQAGGLLGDIVDRGLLRAVAALAVEKPLVFWTNLLLGIYLLFYLGCAVLPLLSLRFLKSFPVILILFHGLYFLFLSGGPAGLNRFRHPVMPVISLLGGIGIMLVLERYRQLKESRSQD